MDISYIGEHLWIGNIGRFSILLAFFCSIFSAYAYWCSHKEEGALSDLWLRRARMSYHLHGIAVLTVIVAFFGILVNNFFEYKYVFANTSKDLPFAYVFSAFWKDQEGSFLLWIFWNVILGWTLMRWAPKDEKGAVFTFSLIQMTLLSMILGIFIGDLPIGLRPFELLRESMQAPIFQEANYLSKIDGNGLNPLLQNYWMTIHPPTLFLGFAAAAFPFSFCVSAMWRKDYRAALRRMLPWTLFAGGILGIGILMGAAWAYEALNFGGYWAWDPVENTSLVAWLILVAAIHGNLVSNATGRYIRMTMGFYLLSFLMVLYSTYLTRSGVLGETSVHSFVAAGVEAQLLYVLLGLAVWAIVLLVRNFKDMPKTNDEEQIVSRDFWMFIGVFVLLLSTVLITFTTSIPVFNKLLDLTSLLIKKPLGQYYRSQPVDIVGHYNKYQLWIGVAIAMLSTVSFFLKYQIGERAGFVGKRSLAWIVGVGFLASALALVTAPLLNIVAFQYKVLLYAGYFASILNLIHLFDYRRKFNEISAGMLAHFGFGLMLIGILISGVNKRYISTNTFAQLGLVEDKDKEFYKENIILYRGLPMIMDGYQATYVGDTLIGHVKKFQVDFVSLDKAKTFTTYPNVLYNKDFTKVAATNPSTKRYWNRDIYTHISSMPPQMMDIKHAKEAEDTLNFKLVQLALGDTLWAEDKFMVLDSVVTYTDHLSYQPNDGDFVLAPHLHSSAKDLDTSFQLEPILVLNDGEVSGYADQADPLRLRVRVDNTTLDTALVQSDKYNEVITLKLGKPYRSNGFTYQLLGVDRDSVDHPLYVAKEGDISINVRLEMMLGDKRRMVRIPFVIRETRVLELPVFVDLGASLLELVKIDPERDEFVLKCSQSKHPERVKYSFMVADNAARTDYIVLQAIVFEGINLLWIGCILMMCGFLIGMWKRIRNGKA